MERGHERQQEENQQQQEPASAGSNVTFMVTLSFTHYPSFPQRLNRRKRLMDRTLPVDRVKFFLTLVV